MFSPIPTLHSAALKLTERLLSGEKGATAVEYGIMVGLIAIVIITVVGLLGGQLQSMFQSVANQL